MCQASCMVVLFWGDQNLHSSKKRLWSLTVQASTCPLGIRPLQCLYVVLITKSGRGLRDQEADPREGCMYPVSRRWMQTGQSFWCPASLKGIQAGGRKWIRTLFIFGRVGYMPVVKYQPTKGGMQMGTRKCNAKKWRWNGGGGKVPWDKQTISTASPILC